MPTRYLVSLLLLVACGRSDPPTPPTPGVDDPITASAKTAAAEHTRALLAAIDGKPTKTEHDWTTLAESAKRDLGHCEQGAVTELNLTNGVELDARTGERKRAEANVTIELKCERLPSAYIELQLLRYDDAEWKVTDAVMGEYR